MKKKIYRMLVLIAALAIFFTVVFVTLVYYELFRAQILDDLRTFVLLVKEEAQSGQVERLGEEIAGNGMRLTLTDRDGNVVFDSEADQSRMENHGARPEIAEAAATGEGRAVRRSATLSESTFYYAVRLEDGGVLRVAKDAGSIYSIFARALPFVGMVLAILMALCMLVAHVLTVKLISPIERLAENLDEYNDSGSYEELTPFVRMIQKQHQDIVKNAQMRQEFTANVSHELKTPLTAISGYAELIENGMAEQEDVVRFAHGIHNSAGRLLTLINDIIRLSELDGTEREWSMERLDLYDLASACVEMLALSAEKHHVTIALLGTRESYILGNKQMIEELLYNLCDNAIRYNNEGGSVTVQVCHRRRGTLLLVKDTGIGIPKEHQERIFERFYRVDKSRSKSTGGTGLGLAIVKHIVARHGASLELESEAGKGTTIQVSFPEYRFNS